MFIDMDGVMQASARKKAQRKEDIYFAVNFVQRKPSKYHAEVTPTSGMRLIPAHIFDPFRKLRSIRKWDMAMDSNPQDETSFTTQHLEVFLKYVENEYSGKQRRMSVN